MVEVAALLEPISGSDPCGENLEYDAAFAELERTSAGKPEQQVGSTVVAAEEPEWREVAKQSTKLLGRSKDLRVAVLLAKALLRSADLPGFAEGLAVINGMVDQYWEGLHPRLDPEDDNDPTMRMNILAELTDAKVLNWVKLSPLVTVKGLGRYTLRDYLIAVGEMPAPKPADPKTDPKPPDQKVIQAAFNAADVAEVRATRVAALQGASHVAAMENRVTELVGVGNAVNLQKLRGVLDQAAKAIAKHLEARGVPVDEPQEAVDAAAQPGQADEAGEGAAVTALKVVPVVQKGLHGEIATREDVIKAIDMICDYYKKFEPSSPVPLFLQRSRRLANMDFLEVLRNLAPDGIKQVEVIRGPNPEDGSK